MTVPNTDPPEIEIRLRRSRLFRISGYAIDASGAVAPLARTTFVTLDRDGASMSARTAQTERGAFTVRGLAPGEYQIRAELGYPDDHDRQFGFVSVTVAAADVENVAIAMSNAATIRGRLTFEGGAPPPAASLAVRAQSPRGRLSVHSGSMVLPSKVGADYTYELSRLFGPHEILVDGAPGWVIKSVRFRGEERVNVPTDFKTNRDSTTVDVVLTNRTATVVGRVTDPRGQPLEDARVVMFSTDPRQWDAISPSRQALQRDGAYEIKGVPAGEYYMAVLKPAAPFSMWDRKIYEELSKSADRVAVLEGDVRTVDLTVR